MNTAVNVHEHGPLEHGRCQSVIQQLPEYVATCEHLLCSYVCLFVCVDISLEVYWFKHEKSHERQIKVNHNLLC